LNQLGYKLKVDGIFGPSTKVAVKQFQTDNAILVDGVVGDVTRHYLTHEPTKHLQMALNSLGAGLLVDGILGHKTEAAVVEFQKTHGLV